VRTDHGLALTLISDQNVRRECVNKEPQAPQGTIALLLVYALIIVFLWTNVYLTMLSRGVTQ